MSMVDVNVAGASSLVKSPADGRMQITIGGTWGGATVELQKRIGDGSFLPMHTFTENESVTVDIIGRRAYRFFTTGTPDLKCEVDIG